MFLELQLYIFLSKLFFQKINFFKSSLKTSLHWKRRKLLIELLFNLNLVVYGKWEQVMILILINVFLTFILFPFYFEQSHYFDGSFKIGRRWTCSVAKPQWVSKVFIKSKIVRAKAQNFKHYCRLSIVVCFQTCRIKFGN